MIGFPFASWLRRYGKYSAPFWLFGIVRLATASVMMSPISGSEVLPVVVSHGVRGRVHDHESTLALAERQRLCHHRQVPDPRR